MWNNYCELWSQTFPSLLLALAGGRVRLVGAAAGLPQQRGAEDANDAQVENEADGESTDCPQEGWHHPMGHKPRPARHHVCDDALHLEVGTHHSADVEELVAVAEEVEAPRGQPLREVGSKQKTGEEGKEKVVTVIGQSISWAAASTAAQEDPVKQRDSVKYKRDDKRSCPQNFTSLWEL